MIHIDLDATERSILMQTLESYLSDMSFEIADTDRMEFREELKAKRQVLNKILDAVKQAHQSA
jgi:hypothetical protein